MSEKQDPGKHYRYTYKGIKLDLFRICQIYEVYDFALQTIIKKALKAGEPGHKDMRQDLLDIINSAQRKLEMLDEDENIPAPKPICTYPDCNCPFDKPITGDWCARGYKPNEKTKKDIL